MRRSSVLSTALVLSLPLGMAATMNASAHERDDDDHDRHRQALARYVLQGDAGGSKFEGIGVDEDQDTFYVSEVTGGEIHRGDVDRRRTMIWKDEGEDGRMTARGITVDDRDRVYIAGGPNNIDNPGAPHLWVYSEGGKLLAALEIDAPDVFLNDVVIGPDGAAYFTNSNNPEIYRVAKHKGNWSVELWKDATEIKQEEGFNLGGIVVSPDGKSLVVAQGNVGKLWRFDLADRSVTEIEIGDADVTNADGLVLEGNKLIVIRNFSHRIATMRLNDSATRARLIKQVPTAESRVFTTGKIAEGRLLLVDSKFDEEVASPPYHVVGLPLERVLPGHFRDHRHGDDDRKHDDDGHHHAGHDDSGHH